MLAPNTFTYPGFTVHIHMNSHMSHIAIYVTVVVCMCTEAYVTRPRTFAFKYEHTVRI